MSKRRLIGWIAFYIGIVLAILVTYFYLQERYARNYPRQGVAGGSTAAFMPVMESVPAGVFDG